MFVGQKPPCKEASCNSFRHQVCDTQRKFAWGGVSCSQGERLSWGELPNKCRPEGHQFLS